MQKPKLEVADVVREHGKGYLASRFVPSDHKRVLLDLTACRTAAKGGHVERCDECGHQSIAYNSCRNRHCPKCQGSAQKDWLADREKDLLPVEYFHVIFTVPSEITGIAFQNKKIVYTILFRAAWETLRQIASDPKHLGAEIGAVTVLHTWGQNLQLHPHLHCVIPGGGLSKDGTRWVSCRRGFFLPVKVLARLFRGKFLHQLNEAYDAGTFSFHGGIEHLKEKEAFRAHVAPLYEKDWYVYSKRPFSGPDNVLRYLSRYTHRVAISNHRLVGMNDGTVSFRWKDYTKGSRHRIQSLKAVEFLRRFLMHVLPKGYVRIRHFGFMANAFRKEKLALCRRLLDFIAHEIADHTSENDENPNLCPHCRRGIMTRVGLLMPVLFPKNVFLYDTS